MTEIATHPLPALDVETRLADTRAGLLHHIANPAFDALARDFADVALPQPYDGDPDLRKRMEALQRFADDHLEFRKGSERQRVDWTQFGELSDVTFRSPNAQRVARYAGALGHISATHPQLRFYRVAAGFGGFGRGPYERLKFLREETLDKGVQLGHVVLLGSTRELFLDKQEDELVADFAPDAVDEFDLMCGVAEKLFLQSGQNPAYRETVLPPAYEAEGDAIVREYETGGPMRLSVIKASKPLGLQRVTTINTIQLLGGYVGAEITSEDTVLQATHARYRPYQHKNGLNLLSLTEGETFGVHVETIGFDTTYDGQLITPAEVLQEVKSDVDVTSRLHERVLDLAA